MKFRWGAAERHGGLSGFAGFGETIAEGECYPWAFKYVMKHPGAVLVQGTTIIPFHVPPRKISHAWVEHKGKAYDWQTMEAGYGGKFFRGKGYPLDVFYGLYKPTNMRRYTKDEAMVALLRSRGGENTGGSHYGPWHGRGSKGPVRRKAS